MKKLIFKIDNLIENICSGLLSKKGSLKMIREIRKEIELKFEQDSDQFNTCIESLVDAHGFATEIN